MKSGLSLIHITDKLDEESTFSDLIAMSTDEPIVSKCEVFSEYNLNSKSDCREKVKSTRLFYLNMRCYIIDTDSYSFNVPSSVGRHESFVYEHYGKNILNYHLGF